MEGLAPFRFRLDPNPPATPLHILFADGQSDSRSGKLFSSMQPLEKDKNPVEMPTINSQAVVLDGKSPFVPAVLFSRDMHARDFCAVVLDGIPEEVLEYLDQLR